MPNDTALCPASKGSHGEPLCLAVSAAIAGYRLGMTMQADSQCNLPGSH